MAPKAAKSKRVIEAQSNSPSYPPFPDLTVKESLDCAVLEPDQILLLDVSIILVKFVIFQSYSDSYG
jgi:hypothetical protein